MFQRLRIAKDLLREDGIILVSIDDSEIATLRLLMEKVFGAGNFIATLVWEKGKKGDAKFFSVTHEYVVAFAASKAFLVSRGVVLRRRKLGVDEVLAKYSELRHSFGNDHSQIREEIMKWFRSLRAEHPAKKHKHYNCSDERGLYFPDNFHGPDDGRENRPRYDIFHPVTGKSCKKPSTGWRWEEERTRKSLAEVPPRIHFGPDENTIPCRKSYLSEVDSEPFPSVFYKDGRAATLEVEKLVGKGVFNFPKDVEVIADLIRLVTEPDDLVLDFFAGSGTTAQAVLESNQADGTKGRRRFILVSSTEATEDESAKNVCRDICAVRVGNVIRGYGNAPALGGDFAYLRTHRIQSGRLLEIEHAQVWTALQLAHLDGFTAYEDAPFLWAGNEESAICYVPRFRREFAAALRRKVKESASVAFYSWQPQTLKQHVRDSHVTHLSVSDTLTRRFGLNLTLSPV